MSARRTLPGLLCMSVLLAACAGAGARAGEPPPLAGTSWRLLRFDPADPAAAKLTPTPPATYEATFGTDGSLAMKLDCNRATGRWTAAPTDAQSGTLSVSPMAMTRAMCVGPSLDTRIAGDTAAFRGYRLTGDELHLILGAGGGDYVWQRIAP